MNLFPTFLQFPVLKDVTQDNLYNYWWTFKFWRPANEHTRTKFFHCKKKQELVHIGQLSTFQDHTKHWKELNCMPLTTSSHGPKIIWAAFLTFKSFLSADFVEFGACNIEWKRKSFCHALREESFWSPPDEDNKMKYFDSTIDTWYTRIWKTIPWTNLRPTLSVGSWQSKIAVAFLGGIELQPCASRVSTVNGSTDFNILLNVSKI